MSPNAETVTLSMYYAYKARAAEGVFLDKAITFGLDFPGLRPVLNELVRFGVVRPILKWRSCRVFTRQEAMV